MRSADVIAKKKYTEVKIHVKLSIHLHVNDFQAMAVSLDELYWETSLRL